MLEEAAYRYINGQLETAYIESDIELSELLAVSDNVALADKNIASFVAGGPCLNMLLWGEKGSGKSTLLKLLALKYAKDNLVTIEFIDESAGAIYKLYKLIYNRFIASQMAPAIFDTISATIDANSYTFKANGQTIKFKGFMTLYIEGTDDKEVQEQGMLPELTKGQALKKQKINSKQSFTEPPARYTEASLVKALEEKGIGRPSTYSPTISTILERRYIEKEAKQLKPTELGKIVNKLLTENFTDVINVEFTAKIEDEFDQIAEGNEEWKKMIRQFYGPFEKEVKKAEEELEHVKIEDEVSDVQCEKCGRMMVYKYGRYGKFLACPGYPECKNAKPIVETIDVPCPKCGAKVQVRKTKRRKNYYICENNPKSCDYISWDKPKPGEKWNPEDAPKPKKTKKATKKTTKRKTKK